MRVSGANLERMESAQKHMPAVLCTICGSREINSLNSPCGHSFLCFPCAEQFQEHEGTICNACRQPSALVHISCIQTVRVQPKINSRIVLELISDLWRVWRARLQERRAASNRLCATCGKTTHRRKNVVHLPCGHSEHCSTCADVHKARFGQYCPVCREASALQTAVTVQTCDICFTDAPSNDLFAIGPCGHQLCINCSVQYVRTALGNVADQVKKSGLRCPMMIGGCEGFLVVDTIERSLFGRSSLAEPSMQPISRAEVDRLARFVEEAGIPPERRLACANQDCARLLSVDMDALLLIERPEVVCPHCNKKMCARCKILWHGALTCDEVSEMQGSTDIGGGFHNEASESLVNATTKPCPNCSYRISHYHGHACHHIRPGTGCLNCGQHFCYSCLRPGRHCSACTTFCRTNDLLQNIVSEPFPYDQRCGCPFCPDCRPSSPCAQCDGSCVVCQGVVPPGRPSPKVLKAKPGNASCESARSDGQPGRLGGSWFRQIMRRFARNYPLSS